MSWTRTHRQLAVMADVMIELKHLQYPVGKVVKESYPYGVDSVRSNGIRYAGSALTPGCQ